MDRFADLPDQYDPHVVEDRVFSYWDAVDAYEQTVEHRADGEPFFFVDGPPYTSGSAHMGHAWNKSLKDVYIRYKRMLGHHVTDRPGYDMHGLPIETRVEEELSFENKQDIEAYGVENFLESCREFAEDSLQSLQADFKSFGVWMDWDDPYKTVTPEYMEAAWWAFRRCHEQGLVERGQRSVSQCPRCETGLANNEVEYADVEDPSIYVRFPLVDREGALVIWTTTPWTIPANTFVAVGEELTYAKVAAEKSGDREVLYIETGLVEEVLKAGRFDDYEILEERAGAEMVGWAYEHPLEDVVDHPGGAGAFEVYTADYVEADRTGLVHSAPGHGEEDFERGVELGLETFCPVGADGVFDERAGSYAGSFVRDANEAITADLDTAGYLLARGTTEHSYGHCWRCDTGIIQIVTDQWFVTVTDVKDELLDNIDDAEWYPQWARENRFRDFVEDAPDWNVSRQRYWGIPMPIWLPTGWDGDMDNAIVIGDRESLADRVDQDVDPDSIDLHKDTVDDLTITENGTTYERIPDVFDVWLDSSVATWGTLDYPAEKSAYNELWPADLIIEAHDQTRGWFWSQLGMGTAAVGQSPYKQVLMHGHALMPDGRAMSKSKDIRVDPGEVIDEHGADPMRAFLLSLTARGEDMSFSWEETRELQRRLNIFWNVARFPLPYMRMDGFDPAATTVADVDLEPVDRWVLSRLQTVQAQATDAMEAYRQDRALETVLDFVVEDVSRYYVQLVRDRVWEEGESASKRAAYATLYRVLRETVALLAPFVPFVTEEVYRHLTGENEHDTVHMCDWPSPDPQLRDPQLERDIDIVREIEQAGAAARQQGGRQLRWPVRRVIVSAPTADVVDAVDRHSSLLGERLNTRTLAVYGPDEQWEALTYAAEADMSELGPTLGDEAGRVMEALNDARVDEPAVESFEAAVEAATGLDVDLQESVLTPVEQLPENVERAKFAGIDDEQADDEPAGAVYVDTQLTDDIEGEGFAREVIRRVQEMRKDLELEMDDRIRLEVVVEDDRVAALLDEREAMIATEVRAAEFGPVTDGYRASWDVEGVEIELAVEPLAEATA